MYPQGITYNDMRRLKRLFLVHLNKEANANEEICLDKVNLFHATGKAAFSVDIIPYIIQDLLHEGLIKECENKNQVKITRRGKLSLLRNVENNAYSILAALANSGADYGGRVVLRGDQLRHLTDLTPSEINDAITILEEGRFIRAYRILGTAPYTFHQVILTSRGRYEYQQLSSNQSLKPEEKKISVPRTPVGSPFGFTPIDWEIVKENTNDPNKLNVVFGYQFQSKYYDTDELKKNVYDMFDKAIDDYNGKPNSLQISLDYKNLEAGYGQHLFNEISRDIISADIAVFEISHQNPNVMIEIGVALTWGVRVLLIQDKKSRAEILNGPPSDISGQTYAVYSQNGATYEDVDHSRKLTNMVEMAARMKRRLD